MTRYKELQLAYARSSERDGARLDRLCEEARISTANMLRTLVRCIRAYLGRPDDADIVYFTTPDTGERCHDDNIWNHLLPETVPDDGNGYHTSLVVAVSWPQDDGEHYTTGVCSQLDVVPLRDGRWTIAFEERASHAPMPIDVNDLATLTAFADEVYTVVREYFDTYALPPEVPSRRTLGFVTRIDRC
ncbi:MAG: hypothetical protein KF773_24655 [Deltaproteobacteria bacterium]|nr:hypothetical protein [Deltaproteobacteria bacterium]